MNSSETTYQEYFENRKPSALGQKLWFIFNQRLWMHAQKIIQLKPNSQINEIGVGHGHFLERVRQQGHKTFGIDINRAVIEKMRTLGFEGECAEAPPLPLNTPQADLFWLSHLIEHVGDCTKARQLLSEIRGKLVPGGYIVIIAPDILSWKQEFWNVDWSHQFPTSPYRMEQLLHETGFEILRCGTQTCTVINPILAFILDLVHKLIPYNLLDHLLFRPLFKRRLAYSWMGVFGWRQIFMIGKKTN